MSIAPKAEQDRNQEATVYLGNLDEKCTDALIWELMLSTNVFLPKDRISMNHQGFGFCEFLTEEDSEYAVKIMNQIKLYGKPIRVNKASYDKKQLDIGANLFIGNLDLNVDENALYDTFATFGSIAEHPKISRDPTTGQSKGYGFVSYHDFDAADMAIENMNGQFFGGQQITVQYAFKKDGKGERHGSAAERLLAAQAKKHAIIPGGPGSGPGFAYQGQFAGALAQTPAVPAVQTPVPAPPVAPVPPVIPTYAPQVGIPPPPQGVPVYQPTPQAYPPPPPGFPQSQINGYPQYPPPPPGFPVANGVYPQTYDPSQPPVPPPPLRLGFDAPKS
ncbi:hypothetical protein TREMEDRAFT_71330 [Tremella mesenterica DSM 1558]|uniref:uncharacterized protein n=1 Tax=Tremella mesenterica (strain ATCC 24925 / CBS 8224 / DSM 1558 / NBRC 9311 / NRRL Y-6157 / RJB 2259-6 / UBC 559-6) TaxID=578456 RepID=UPI0003F49794|nr:uncharacterized protein TREMEDRAFT_71330 [Tremella mesenterica DSM 1558]EIW70558.1 hypothetical protein TREMEDRAFT_71330 [Tremella mesenterica DSM 1558]